MEETTKKHRRSPKNFFRRVQKHMVSLYNAGKSRAEIIREYDLSATALDQWISRINKTGSSREADNRTEAEKELIVSKIVRIPSHNYFNFNCSLY